MIQSNRYFYIYTTFEPVLWPHSGNSLLIWSVHNFWKQSAMLPRRRVHCFIVKPEHCRWFFFSCLSLFNFRFVTPYNFLFILFFGNSMHVYTHCHRFDLGICHFFVVIWIVKRVRDFRTLPSTTKNYKCSFPSCWWRFLMIFFSLFVNLFSVFLYLLKKICQISLFRISDLISTHYNFKWHLKFHTFVYELNIVHLAF